MAGLRKPKKYNWQDSNLALFGSDLERQVKKTAALGEPAWEGAGIKPGLKIWRIVKFIVTDWPEEDYGKFYDGDSYIILNVLYTVCVLLLYLKNRKNGVVRSKTISSLGLLATRLHATHLIVREYSKTYTEPPSADLKYDVHFWIGSESSQDEYGTAAYKTVELDTLLDDKAVQHREVMGSESELFKSYFKELVISEGGAETGFRHVEPKEYRTRLMKVRSEKGQGISIREVPLSKKSLNSDDVFILDTGTIVWQYNGNNANPFEKARSMQFLQNIEAERAGHAKGEVIDEHSISEQHVFFSYLSDDEIEEDQDEGDSPSVKKLMKVSDDSGKIARSDVKDGNIAIEDFKSDDVYLFDSLEEVFVWVGEKASPAEKKNGMSYAHNYCQETKRPFLPIHVVKEGRNYASLDIALSA